MPKNKEDIRVCVNHPKQELINVKYYAMAELPVISANPFPSRDTIYVKSMSCPECDYIEFIKVGEVNIPTKFK